MENKLELVIYRKYSEKVYRIFIYDFYLEEKKKDLWFAMIEEMQKKIRGDITICDKSEELAYFISFLTDKATISVPAQGRYIAFKDLKPLFYYPEDMGFMGLKNKIRKFFKKLCHEKIPMATMIKKRKKNKK
jgi:hypothetical protein